MEKFQINKKLLPVKAHYFLINGAHAGVIPFVPVYAKQLGISAGAVGIIYAVLCCLTVISKPLFGGIVDFFQKLKQVVITLIIIDIAASMGLNFIPQTPESTVNTTNIKIFCYRKSSYLISYDWLNCELNATNSSDECKVACALCQSESALCRAHGVNDYTENNPKYFETTESSLNETFNSTEILLAKCQHDGDAKCYEQCYGSMNDCETVIETNPTLQLWMLSIFIGIIYLANGSIVSLSDAACYNTLGTQSQLFGKQRLWGTIGWGIFALLTGYLNQIFTGASKTYNFSAGFYMLVILFIIDLLVMNKLKLSDVRLSKHIFKDVGTLIVQPRISFFILAMFCIGVATGFSRSYLFWYLRTTLDASQLVLGFVSGIQCFLGELPFFFFFGWILKKLGHIHIFTMSFIAYGIRFLIHSFLLNPWWALPIEILQGPCFGSFYAAMTSYAKVVAPEGTEATVQGIVSGAFEGLGVATGSLLGGFAMGAYGGRKTFFWTGIISLLIGFFYSAAHVMVSWKKTDADREAERKT